MHAPNAIIGTLLHTYTLTTATTSPSLEAATLVGGDVQPKVSAAAHKQVHSLSRDKIKGIVFTSNTITSSSMDQNHIITEMINKAVPSIPSLCGLTQWLAAQKDISMIW
ncbi:uncharacterized protein BJ212DRAFT_1486800 [Suillus subaureus]|uniref:Uncharacterized protein n=1 Tax=Suillus subaureus TaxID=48587 RepID=A0A9P7DVS5_9AGAM|nr:uncharacterized protein BJ212DRAFT_1486800 [Suillus subaureus]KAG1804263.1 hypothetical protein BJ212DRAFT_1486800 [Suillus subaureus]